MRSTLFISDLHLAEDHSETTEVFLRFSQGIKPSVEALYVLGDLFEYWIGDDDLGRPFHQTIIKALVDIAQNGISLFFMHGNRDFLLGDAFFKTCHGTLLPDPTLINLYGIPTLLMHGDTLCTADTEYLRFRTTTREKAWQESFLAKPLTERRGTVEKLRDQSEEAKRAKSPDIMDVVPSTVEMVLRSHGYPKLIHGHTHRPAKHICALDGRTCERWVLTDWHGKSGGYLEVTPQGWKAHLL